MADKYLKYINGHYIEMTENEVDQIKLENQRQLLAQLQTDTVSNQDLIDIIMGSYTMTKPDGQTVPVTEAVGTTINLPLKLGQKWEMMLDGTRFTYRLVDDPEAVGTSEDNPIIYHSEVPLIDNAFYKKDGVIVVYMNGEWVDWNVD